MIHKYTKFVVFILTILSALVISEYIEMRFDQGASIKGVTLKMAITLIVYVPLFSVLDTYLKKISTIYASKSKKIAKSSFLGLTLGFFAAILILYFLLVFFLNGSGPIEVIKYWVR